MANKTYSELLKDPRWQKKRLQVMERDEFMCQSCQGTEATLNVHHCVPYRKNCNPWDYELDELTTLCNECHDKISELINEGTHILMGRCWSIDSAKEMINAMRELDGLNPWQMRRAQQLLQLGIREKLFLYEHE